MSIADYAEHWKQYWKQRYEGRDYRDLRKAAQSPIDRWLTVDTRHLANDEIEIGLDHLSSRPDVAFDAARQGFTEFVSEVEIDNSADTKYDLLPIHIINIDRRNSYLFSFEAMVSDANTVTEISAAQIEAEPTAELRAIATSFACPDGHHTRIRQPIYDVRTLEVCGHDDCLNSVFINETRTQARRVVEFSVSYHEVELRCVATGRYAEMEHKFQNVEANADLSMTGIPRLITSNDGSVTPIYEVLHVEPT